MRVEAVGAATEAADAAAAALAPPLPGVSPEEHEEAKLEAGDAAFVAHLQNGALLGVAARAYYGVSARDNHRNK